jgi:hypothetical protein
VYGGCVSLQAKIASRRLRPRKHAAFFPGWQLPAGAALPATCLFLFAPKATLFPSHAEQVEELTARVATLEQTSSELNTELLNLREEHQQVNMSPCRALTRLPMGGMPF